ncbi:hypothetical protein C9374_007807 [Naegleria lovaniensis]|uniref:Cobalamin-independent methionine synthase MetE N-terminal domain-containing protein n=1 Tax=Naegleria lovaniensis TaxID=51637 RepID=A0AA88KLQ8_NAELO|nr:uncharacterized protein C9374_007807 [Naegleria lovaniensis]KAG2379169.1 hypothetical protein C9374_007807 [Naegleria lovaniensis]
MARGRAPTGKPTAACEMTKWFDTNYHFITPEIEPSQEFQLIRTSLFEQVKEAQEVIGLDRVKVVLVGPLTWLYLAKGVEFTNGADDSKKLHTVLPKLLPIYQQVLKQLSEMGVKWVQIDEPILVMDLNEEWQQAFVKTYSQDLVASQQGFACKILLATYFGPLLNNVKTCVQLHVDAVHLDGVRSGHQQQEHLENFLSELTRFEKTHPEIKKKIISLGLVDGRNVWKTDLEKCVQTIKSVVNHSEFGLSHERVWIAPSCSLLHVPLDLSLRLNLMMS